MKRRSFLASILGLFGLGAAGCQKTKASEFAAIEAGFDKLPPIGYRIISGLSGPIGGAIPGSGPVLNVLAFEDSIYAWRADEGGIPVLWVSDNGGPWRELGRNETVRVGRG